MLAKEDQVYFVGGPMKINISIEATAQEIRQFFGLPNVQPLQDEILQVIQEKMRKGVAGFDALTLMKPLFPTPMQPLETLQKSFWEALTKAGSNAAKEESGNQPAEK
jgi:hypothetical protein